MSCVHSLIPHDNSQGRSLGSISSRALVAIAALLVWAPVAAAQAPLQPRVSTNRGCLEYGDQAIFLVGEPIVIQLRVASSTYDRATSSLFVVRPDHYITGLGLGSLRTNVTYFLGGHVGAPTGVHELLFKATADAFVSTASCSFRVVSGQTTPRPTRTPTSTRTAVPTRTPTVTAGVGTPSAGLSATLRTSRGCIEDGDSAELAVGELVTVSFDVASGYRSFASVTLFDVLANGFVNTLSFGNVATNRPYSFQALVAPPLGTETLRLRAVSFDGSSATAVCSFRVVGQTQRTSTPTRTVTPTRTATPSATAASE